MHDQEFLTMAHGWNWSFVGKVCRPLLLTVILESIQCKITQRCTDIQQSYNWQLTFSKMSTAGPKMSFLILRGSMR